jgi:hypothetical protein
MGPACCAICIVGHHALLTALLKHQHLFDGVPRRLDYCTPVLKEWSSMGAEIALNASTTQYPGVLIPYLESTRVLVKLGRRLEDAPSTNPRAAGLFPFASHRLTSHDSPAPARATTAVGDRCSNGAWHVIDRQGACEQIPFGLALGRSVAYWVHHDLPCEFSTSASQGKRLQIITGLISPPKASCWSSSIVQRFSRP